jgi:Ca2+-transporting ATPase
MVCLHFVSQHPIDPDVMKRHPRRQSERITSCSFLRTMAFTGFLTAGVAFGVYYYMLQAGTMETARSYAFAVLVFAELLRSFGARSETKPIWRISLFTNINLVSVVAISFGLQVWSQHNETLGRFLKTSTISFIDGLLLLALGAIPLLVLEIVKVIRNGWMAKQSTNQTN